jgi:CheY-like chemotaxis protein
MRQILIIEDNEMIRENAAELLELSGYKVSMASDGLQGIEKAKEQHYDVILCDVMMPGASGHQVFEELHNGGITLKSVFIFISASVERRDVEAALKKGVKAYIRKPFEEEDLLNTIEQCLSAPTNG